MTIEQYLHERKQLIDHALEKYLPSKNTYPEIIHDAVYYSVFAGGKRLRAILLLAAAQAVGGNPDKILPAACAIECIHTYSLIHDDLPAMDDDDFRRGVPTCHKVYGEGMAVLAGDALLTYAFKLLSEMGLDFKFPENVIIRVINEISQLIGTQGLIGGQVVDLQSEDMVIDEETQKYIHQNKTGALFCAAIRTGAILSGANQLQLASLTEYAEYLGLAFQITDDILDVEGDTIVLGKLAGSDLKNNKATYPALMGLENSRMLVRECISEGLANIKIFGTEADPLREIIQYVGSRNC